MRLIAVVLFVLLTSGASAQVRTDDVRTYIFGNSLIHHLTSSGETTVPHWLHQLALADGRRYAVDGQWGLLRDFAKDLPPIDNWSFAGVPQVWNSDAATFNKASFNTMVMNPPNFIQYKGADAPYDGDDNPDKQTPLGDTLTVLDWVSGQKPELVYFIYEGWADMSAFSSAFPPNASAMAKYHAFNRGEYHGWYVDYVAKLKESRPKLDIRFIPVASVLSKLLTETALKDLKPTDLYSDDAPHGTASTYFLAAVISYTAIYEKKAPESFAAPAALHPLIKDNYRSIIEVVCAEMVERCGQ
ncbi:MAG: hypothetical protein ACT4OU_13295 [Hyphomicrobium sp.]